MDDTGTEITKIPPAEISGDNTEAIIQSMFEADMDSKKSRYIGYRASGFRTKEALQLTGITLRSLFSWRASDPIFVSWETQLPQLRKTVGVEYSYMEFLRNYRLILRKDYEVFKKSLSSPDALTKFDQDYLMKARTHYTPQQLQIMQQMTGMSQSDATNFNFNEFILSLQRKNADGTTNTVTIQGNR
jgi:hypothetical protein